jgi:hypothetical protein
MNISEIFDQITTREPGTYLISRSGLINYSDRWAYGYAVGIRPLEMADITPWTLVGVWKDGGGRHHYDLVQHVDTYQDAARMAQAGNQVTMYSFREEKVIDV